MYEHFQYGMSILSISLYAILLNLHNNPWEGLDFIIPSYLLV